MASAARYDPGQGQRLVGQSGELAELGEEWEQQIKPPNESIREQVSYFDCKYLVHGIKRYFKIGNVLGEGASGSVVLGETTAAGKKFIGADLPDKVAIKIVDLTRVNKVKLKEEIAILKEINLPQVVRYYGCFVGVGVVWIITEYLTGYTLFQCIRHGMLVTDEDRLTVTNLLAQAIVAIHQKGIMHRDIKPDNIIINRLPNPERTIVLKLIDFGLACDTQTIISVSCQTPLAGTLGYFDPYGRMPGMLGMFNLTMRDWWAYAVTIFALYTGHAIYDVALGKEHYEDLDFYYIPTDEYLTSVGMPAHVRELLLKIFQPMIRRPSDEGVLKILGLSPDARVTDDELYD